MRPLRNLSVLAIAAALALALAAGAGAGTSRSTLSPAAYRAQAGALCTQASKRIADLPESASTKPAELAKKLSKALGAVAPLVPAFRALVPPPAQKALHDTTVNGLTDALRIGNQIAASLAKGGDLAKAMAKVQTPFLRALSTLQTGFKSLRLTTCQSVLGAALGGAS